MTYPSPQPYVVYLLGREVGRFETFASALAEVQRHQPRRCTIVNDDKCDGDEVDGRLVIFDGLTEEEREQL